MTASLRCGMRSLPPAFILAAACVGIAVAQPPPSGPDTRTARERALIDITGQWVAVINEDWLWRMVTPPVGDTASVPLNQAGRAAALAWERERDVAENRLCRAFGPPGLIRQPTRIRVDWENDDALIMQFDAGSQTRLLQFGADAEPAELSLQGHSVAAWTRTTQARGLFGGGSDTDGGALFVRTSNMAPGYLRPNGVPYGAHAVMKEYFRTFTLTGSLDSVSWLIVTTIVEDPEFLTTEFIFSSQFRKESDRSTWSPRPCDIAPPPIDEPLYTPGPFG